MIISALDRKLIRDLIGIRGQALAIILVIAAGIATYVMSLCALASLSRSQHAYYERYRFADVFSSLKRAPQSLVPRIEQIEGVSRVQTRIVFDVTIDVPGMSEPAVGHLLSVPETGEPKLNALHLRRGRFIEPGREGEVVVNEVFAKSHGLQPSDQITAVINGRHQQLTVVGIVLSPEFIIQIQGGSLIPDDRRYGIFWMGRRQLEAAFDMEGAFNNVSLDIMRGASEKEIIRQLDNLLEPYGSIGAEGRSSQVSHQFISDEIRQLSAMAFIAPLIFLGVAAYMLNVVVSRLIGTQREQIAALRAFGYRKWQVALHYLKLVLVIALLGVILGTFFGTVLGKNLTGMYARFYRFPVFAFYFDWASVAGGVLLSCTAAVLGTLASLRRAIKLPPAEAMRPEPPASFRPTIVERLGLGRLVPQITRMILRNMERRPLKTALSSLGIAMAVAVVILGSYTLDAVTYIMDFQFRIAQRQDVNVAFAQPLEPGAIHEVNRLQGVMKSEPFRAVPVRFESKHYKRRVGILGLQSQADLFRLLDVDENQVDVPDKGLLLSDKLAELLNVGVGDFVTVNVLEGDRPRRRVPVTALITEYNGTNAYMSQPALNRMMGEDLTISGAFLKVDQNKMEPLYQQLKQTPGVASVTIKSAAIKSFETTVAENILTMRFFNILFATVIAFGVVYNSARISLSEQSRELATMRVMGFTRGEASAVLLGELAILTSIAIPLGWLIGYGFAWIASLGLDTELYRIPLIINRSTFAFASIVVAVGAVISGLIVRRRIDRLNLVSVLKTKE